MSTLIPWRRKKQESQPTWHLSSLSRLRDEMDSLFDRFLRDPWGPGMLEAPLRGMAATPRMDLAETDADVKVTFDLPGVAPSDVRVDLAGDVLTVRGETKAERIEGGAEFRCAERHFGSFQRSVRLPAGADPGKVEAQFRNGVLTITIAKSPGAKAKRISVRNG